MRKIPTLFKKDFSNQALVIDEINPGCEWVLEPKRWFATRKFDGTAAAVIDGELYKRYDVKQGRQVPEGAIPCQDPDPITGHWPHWVKCVTDNKEDRYFWEAYKASICPDGTYELCGPKVQGNPEKLDSHRLIKHTSSIILLVDVSFDGLKNYLSQTDIEGIVFHASDGRMCKIKKSNFGIKR